MLNVVRYIYTPARSAPQSVPVEVMDQVRYLYNNPPQLPRDCRPVSIIVADGLDEVRKFRGRLV